MTASLNESGEKQLRARGEIGPAVGSTLDLETVLTTVVARAAQLAGADAAVICECDDRSENFRPRASHNLEQEAMGTLRRVPQRKGEGAVGQLVDGHQPVPCGTTRRRARRPWSRLDAVRLSRTVGSPARP